MIWLFQQITICQILFTNLYKMETITEVSTLEEFQKKHQSLFNAYEESWTAIDIKISWEKEEIINHINKISNNWDGQEVFPWENPINNLLSIRENEGESVIHIWFNIKQ